MVWFRSCVFLLLVGWEWIMECFCGEAARCLRQIARTCLPVMAHVHRPKLHAQISLTASEARPEPHAGLQAEIRRLQFGTGNRIEARDCRIVFGWRV